MKTFALPRLPLAVALGASLTCLTAAHGAKLSEIVQLAQQNDPLLAAARAAADAGREKYIQGRAGLLPVLEANGSVRAVHEHNSSIPDWVNYRSSTAGISLVQPLLRTANYQAFRQGELVAAQAELQLTLAEQELILRAARAYFEALQAQDTLDSKRAEKEAVGQQLAQAQKSYEVGLSAITDVSDARARFDRAAAEEIALANDLAIKQRALARTIHAAPPKLATLDDSASIDILPEAQVRTLADQAVSSSLRVLIAQNKEELARRDVSREQAGHLPTIDLVVNKSENYQTSYSSLGPQSQRVATAGFEVRVPLFQGGLVSSKTREAAANLVNTQEELEDARRQAAFDASQYLLNVQSNIAMTQAYQRALESNETQIKSTRRGLEVGLRTRIDVLNAEQQLYATRRDLATARYQTLLSGLQLKATAGVLNVQDIQELDKLLKE